MKRQKISKFGLENGFSLVEFMVVLAILGFLLAVVVPVWNIFVSNSNLSAAVRQVATDIRDYQSKATSELKFYGIEFTENAGTYRIYSHTNKASLFTSPPIMPPKTISGVTFSRSGGDPVTFDLNRLIFNKDGSCDGGAAEYYIYLKNDRGKERYMSVTTTTGKVTIN